MSPAYNSQAVYNGQLQAVFQGQPNPAVVLNNETPAAGQASLAVAIAAPTPSGYLSSVPVQFECPLGIGAGVFQIQDSDVDVAADYTSINFGGATPGQITSGSVNANGVARVELVVKARFLRILCVTAPSNPVTVRIG